MVVPASLTLLALAQATTEAPAKLPDGVRAMIEAAIAGGDAKTIDTVLRLARDTHPFAGSEIDDIQQRWRLRLAESEAGVRVSTVSPGPTDTREDGAVGRIDPVSVARAVRSVLDAAPDAQITDVAVRPRVELPWR